DPRRLLFGVCLFVFLAHFYAADFKGIWIDEGARLYIANGKMFDQNLNERRPSDLQSVLQLSGPGPHQPLYCMLVNVVMRFSHSYSPIIQYTTNTPVVLLSAVCAFYIARLFLPLEGQLYCLFLYALSAQ